MQLVIVCSELPFSYVHYPTVHCTLCHFASLLLFSPPPPNTGLSSCSSLPHPFHPPPHGQAVYVTATFPFLILAILFFRGVTLSGAGEGLRYLFIPRDVSLQ